MTCGRCKGWMVVEPIYDAAVGVSGKTQEARCLNCGNVEDAVILINRLECRSAAGVARHPIGIEIELGSINRNMVAAISLHGDTRRSKNESARRQS